MKTYTESEVEEMKERWFSESRNRAFGTVLNFLLQQLGQDVRPSRESLLLERQEAILALRDLCDEIGDNDWPEDLHLADIIAKHVFTDSLQNNKTVNWYGQPPIGEEFEPIECKHNCRQPKGWVRGLVCDRHSCDKWKSYKFEPNK